MTEEQLKAIDKIKKMLALAASAGTEEEADTAFKMVASMMAKYGLSEDSLKESRASDIKMVDLKNHVRADRDWEGILLNGVCEVFESVGVRIVSRQSTDVYWKIVGLASDVEISVWFFRYLKLQISKKSDKMKAKERSQYAMGLVVRVCERLQRFKRAREQAREEANRESASNGLAVITTDVVESKMLAIRNALSDLGWSLSDAKTRQKIKLSEGFNKGYADGKNLSLSLPLNNETKNNGPIGIE